MSLSECCVLSDTGFCVGLITHPEKSLLNVVYLECDCEGPGLLQAVMP